MEDACAEAIASSKRSEVDWAPRKSRDGFKTGRHWAGSAAQNEQPLSVRAPRHTKCWSAGANYLQAPLLFALRVYFFWQLFLAGKGKLLNIERTAEFFDSLNIPMPLLNAYLAGATECFGGLLLVVGLARALVAIPVAFTMIVAYVTADYEALTSIFSDPDKFVAAAPFPFLLVRPVGSGLRSGRNFP